MAARLFFCAAKKLLKMNKRQGIIVLVLTAIMLLILAKVFWDAGEKKQRKAKAKQNLRYLNTLIIQNDTQSLWIESYGRAITSRELNISSEVQGKLFSGSITLRPGTSFEKGQVLFRVNASDFEYQIKARRSGFINLMAGVLPDIKVDFKDTYTKWESFFNAIDVNHYLPELPNIKNNAEKTFLASRNILTEYYSIKSDEERLRKYVVTAPFNGSISEVYAESGAIVNPGTPVIRIIQSNHIEIEVPVSVESIGRIKPGSEARIYSKNGDFTGTGRIIRTSETVNSSTQSVNVYVSLQASEGIFPGEYFNVSISAGEAYDVCKIPRRAISENDDVYIIQDSLLHEKPIAILLRNVDSAVVSGLKNNELLVTEPVEFISVHTKVAPLQ